MGANDDMASAYHEAGHAVAAWCYGIAIEYVEIAPKNGGQLVTALKGFSTDGSYTRYKNLWAHVCAAGPLSEALFYDLIGKAYYESTLWSPADFAGLSEFKGGPDSFGAETHPVTWAVKELFVREDFKMAIAVVAGALLAKGRLDGKEVACIAKKAIPKKGNLPLAQHQIKAEKVNGARGKRRMENRLGTSLH